MTLWYTTDLWRTGIQVLVYILKNGGAKSNGSDWSRMRHVHTRNAECGTRTEERKGVALKSHSACRIPYSTCHVPHATCNIPNATIIPLSQIPHCPFHLPPWVSSASRTLAVKQPRFTPSFTLSVQNTHTLWNMPRLTASTTAGCAGRMPVSCDCFGHVISRCHISWYGMFVSCVFS